MYRCFLIELNKAEYTNFYDMIRFEMFNTNEDILEQLQGTLEIDEEHEDASKKWPAWTQSSV